MNLKTVKQLDEWMTKNCFNDNYAIGNRSVLEGFGLEKMGSLFVWYYTERGKRENLNYFPTEPEAVEFAFKAITKDKFANAHIVGFVKSKLEVSELIRELQKRKVDFWKDEIPYGGFDDIRTRIFVVGCDIIKVLDLKEKYSGQN